MGSILKYSNISKFLLGMALFTGLSFAQSEVHLNKPVRAIVIIGNKMTGENVIRRELLFKEGERLTEETLRESRERLINLYLFNRVEMYTIPQEEDDVLLVIEVTEQLYYYPIPILTIRERDWDKLSYGMSVVHYNFRGQNERLWAGLWFGFRPGFGVSYDDQWAGDSLHLTTGFGVSKISFDHRTLPFEERHVFADLSVGKWWNLYFKTEISLEYDRISVDEEYASFLRSGNATEHLWGLQFSIRHDTRDIYAYPQSGWQNRLYIYKNGIFQEFNNYYRITTDSRRYIPVGPLIFAARFYQSYLFGEVPVFRLNYIGFDQRVRGYFSNVREGRHIQTGSFAVRFPIIPIRYFSFSLPGIPNIYTRNLKLGLNGGFFIDTGIVWSKASAYQWNEFQTGFGFGLHLRLPYIEVFRIDYGLNRHFEGEFIFEIGVGF